MKTTAHPYNFNLLEHFPKAREVSAWEGGRAYLAERDGVAYVLVDEGTLADLLDDEDQDLLDGLVKVIAFESEAERTEYIRTRWPESLA